jgi:ankyrin repeat protein
MNDDDDKRPSPTQLLLDAIDKNDTATASSLISSGAVNLNGEPLPLHRAAEHGRVEIMTMLLDAGADINAVDKVNVLRVVRNFLDNRFDALKLLVERGANLGVVDSRGRSLLSIVAIFDSSESERFVILLLDAGAPIDGLSPQLDVVGESVAVFNRLVARGVNFTAMRANRGATIYHYVARNVTCEDDLRFLANVCGNDAVHAVDDDGWTSLHLASLNGNDVALRVLVELGAEIDRQGNDGWTALIAASSYQSSIVELLLAFGADVNLVTNDGRTACLFAAAHENPAALCALVAAGGALDHLNKEGDTPRMIATRNNVALPTAREIDAARRRFAKRRLDLVRERAFQSVLDCSHSTSVHCNCAKS